MGEVRAIAGGTMVDPHAETAVLGELLVSDGHPLDCRDEVTEILRDSGPEVFHDPLNRKVYEAFLSCFIDGGHTDPVTVVGALRREGELTAELFDHVHGLPSKAGNLAASHGGARTLLDLYRRRLLHKALVESSGRVQAGGGSYGEIAGEVSVVVSEVIDASTKVETTFSASQVSEAALGHILHGRTMERGIPMGLHDIDELTGGMRLGQFIVIAGRPGHGKALALDTPIPTPVGWTTMGEIKVGDQVLGANGQPTRVTFATEVQHQRTCFKLTFSDGRTVVADADHLWETSTRASRKAVYSANRKGYTAKSPYAVRTTKEIFETFLTMDGRKNHVVRNAAPLELSEADLPLDPYVLGAWLGDGSSADGRIHSADVELYQEIERRGYELGEPVKQPEGRCPMRNVKGLSPKLRQIGVLNNKHIPQEYLRASFQQRLDLLRGLMDTDGTVHLDGTIVFSVTRKELSDGFRELLATMGYRWHESEYVKKCQNGGEALAYYTGFSAADTVFTLPRKIRVQRERNKYTEARSGHRVIESIEEVESVPVRCIQVDNEDHLYLCTTSMIPTHNTTVGAQVARNVAHQGIATEIFSLEMPKEELGQRNASAETGVPFEDIRDGRVDAEAIERLIEYDASQAEYPMTVDDDPGQTLGEIALKVRKSAREKGAKVFIIDYLQLVKPDKPTGNPTVDVAIVSEGLRRLARTLRVIIIALAQLNRESAGRDDGKPKLTDLRQSGQIEQDANMVILVHLPFKIDPDTARGKEADLILAKNRGGKTAERVMLFDGAHSRFLNPSDMLAGMSS